MEKRVPMDAKSHPGHVYTLLLEGGKYYVGHSAQVETRIAQHFLGGGSRWTVLHKPLQVLACVPGDRVLESAVTIALMCEHGWENVRGAAWCQVDLAACPGPICKAKQYAAAGGKQEGAAGRAEDD